MIIEITFNKLYSFDEKGVRKEHRPISTKFNHFQILNNGYILVIEEQFNYFNDGKSNLYCLNKNLEIQWFLPFRLKNCNDFYVGFSPDSEKVFANTWDCFRVEIDAENGEILNTEFTK